MIGFARSIHVAARASCFAEMGHKVLLITEEPSESGIEGVSEFVPGLAATRAAGIAKTLLSPLLRAMGIRPDHAFRFFAFVRFLQRHRPDIVHAHFAYSYYGWLAGLIGCRPLVVSVMGGDILFDEQGSPTPHGKWLTLELLRQADYITSKSNHLTSVLDQLGSFGNKTERIVWGVPMGKFRRKDASGLRARFGIAQDQRVILSPRILQRLYRVHLLIDAMPLIVREAPQAILLVTEHRPDPKYRAQIVERVSILGLERHVVFCGEVSQQDMPELYSLAELSVAVPSSDGLPQTLLEAMACETPSILSRLPRYEEIVRHEHSAYFVDDTPQAIAAGVTRLLRDPELCARIARNGMEIVARVGNLDEEALRVLSRYRQLIATVPSRVFAVSRLWAAWRSFRRFRATLTA